MDSISVNLDNLTSDERDFWIGVYIPNVYEQFEFIDYSNMS